ncbi:M24 family metallopeptidase [Chloroflexota bacterium]
MKTGNRLQKLRQLLSDKEVDAILISKPESRYYLSGFDGSAGFLLITPQNTILATDFRYIEQAAKQATGYEIFRIAADINGWLPELIADLRLRRVGFEAGHIAFAMYKQLADSLNKTKSHPELVPLDGTVESLRAVKEPEEIKLISEAVKITDNAFEYIEEIIHAGMSEKELAWETEKFLREKGSETIPFDIIVASGPNSALPHASPSERIIQRGEPVMIDMGARWEKYSSDLSRTICLGTPDDTFNKLYDTVLRAQLAAIDGIKEGMPGNEADRLARTVIEQAGYGEAFGHGLGHGIGLASHEQPRLGPGSAEPLTSGAVFTVEPGIYLTGWGGVRIEDVVILEGGKVKVISKARKDSR